MKTEVKNLPGELLLLVILATLWGATYSFIMIGVATIPPLTLIAARTLIAGVVAMTIPASKPKG